METRPFANPLPAASEIQAAFAACTQCQLAVTPGLCSLKNVVPEASPVLPGQACFEAARKIATKNKGIQ